MTDAHLDEGGLAAAALRAPSQPADPRVDRHLAACTACAAAVAEYRALYTLTRLEAPPVAAPSAGRRPAGWATPGRVAIAVAAVAAVALLARCAAGIV
jgi:hypothetical protein